MLANRVLKSILQSSKFNREKFVNNKKKFNMMSVKNRNHNMISRRDFGSWSNSQKMHFNFADWFWQISDHISFNALVS